MRPSLFPSAPVLAGLLLVAAAGPPTRAQETPAPETNAPPAGTTIPSTAVAPEAHQAGVSVGETSASIRLDGRLDEEDWALAGVILDLTQQSPVPGGPTPYHTTVRVLTDGTTLYVGVRALDPQPGRIAIHTMQKDGDLTGDDTVSLAFDTFGDKRTGYFFEVNAAAASQIPSQSGEIVSKSEMRPS